MSCQQAQVVQVWSLLHEVEDPRDSDSDVLFEFQQVDAPSSSDEGLLAEVFGAETEIVMARAEQVCPQEEHAEHVQESTSASQIPLAASSTAEPFIREGCKECSKKKAKKRPCSTSRSLLGSSGSSWGGTLFVGCTFLPTSDSQTLCFC